ncbi:transposase [Sorangium sp. So ce295]|uniref:transposase n=1 Tax=Sorangium sp. So ce295 TaxID=3133295 RepID=UPI003F64251B
MTFVQRFDSTLGSIVHFHVVALDGVFTRQDGPEVVFHQGPAPSRDDIAAVAARVEKRMMRWLRRSKLVDDRPSEERSNEVPELSPLEACMQLSFFGGTFVRLDQDGVPLAEADDEDRFRPRGKSPWAGEVAGFNIHAGVTLRAGDRAGLERLCLYGARPPFSLERISLLPDGRVAYRLRKPRRNGATHLVLAPVHFLARIAALVPPPRYPLLRLSGVLASGSSWRAAVVAHGPAATGIPVPETKTKTSATAPPTCANDITAPPPAATWDPPASARTSLGDGIVLPVYARIDWASLIRRVYWEDALACPCGGRWRLVADIGQRAQREAIVALLTHLGIPTEPPPIARARDLSCRAAPKTSSHGRALGARWNSSVTMPTNGGITIHDRWG